MPDTPRKPEVRNQKVKEEAKASSKNSAEPVIRAEVGKFRDYWHSVAGQKGVKLEWLATCRNWMRNSQPPKIIPGGQHAKSPRDPDRLQRVFTATATGTSSQDWG